MAKEKEMAELEEAEEMANTYRHLKNNKPRTVEEFMEDQKAHEEKKLLRLQNVEPEESYSFRPAINPTSKKIVELRQVNLMQSSYGNLTLNTDLTHGAQKKKERQSEYEKQKTGDFKYTPAINDQSANLERGLNDIMEDTNRKLAQKAFYEDNLKKKEKIENKYQINSTSDKVMHDRFDQDFHVACQELSILRDERALF
jgi:hypothetical protein